MVAETDVADFDDHYRGYEIIFHDSRVSVIPSVCGVFAHL